MEQRALVHEDLRRDGPARPREPDRLQRGRSQARSTAATSTSPVVAWNTVPGARQYEVQVNCGSGPRAYFTANTAWTPLADSAHTACRRSSPSRARPSTGRPRSGARRHLPRAVRAYADNAIDGWRHRGPLRDGQLHHRRRGGLRHTPSVDCDGRRCVGLLDDFDIITPGGARSSARARSSAGRRPTWIRPRVSGTTSPSSHYWVTIARDSNFTTIVQQAYTDEPC